MINMASKLMIIPPHEAQSQTELSLRNSFELLQSNLKPPFSLAIPNSEDYLELNRAIIYGILCEPNLAKTHIKHLHGIVSDGYSIFVNSLIGVVNELYPKLSDSVKSQLIWVSKEMVDVCAEGFDNLLVCLLRQIVAGDFSHGNLWLCFELLEIFVAKWDRLLESEPIVLTYALYTYLRLLADHCKSINPLNLEALKRSEIVFCVKLLKEQFRLCLTIGRDLVRVLQDLVHVPEFRAIWKDLILNPSNFNDPEFTGISQIYCTRTSIRYFSLRISPEMESYLRFMLTNVKLGTQIRHQSWFAKKFLCEPKREALVSDIVRFLCCVDFTQKPSNGVPRWALIGWLLQSCSRSYAEANAKLALFYDWLFFNEKVDNVMNLEPAILLMVNSVPKYVYMTQSLVDFLILLVDNYDEERRCLVAQGVSASFSVLVKRGVIPSLGLLTSCDLLAPFLKEGLVRVSSCLKMQD